MFENSITRVCFLKKALYSLKQSFRVRYKTLLDFFQKFDFNKTKTDHGLFVLANKTMIIIIHINDLLVFDINIDSQIDNIMQNFLDRFQITNLDDVFYYLRIETDIDLNKKIINL